jgi:hypothetical protein
MASAVKKPNRLPFGQMPKKLNRAKMAKMPKHSSASQIGTFDSCNRKWAFEKFFGWSSFSDSARNGVACHKQAERYLKGKKLDRKFQFFPSLNAITEFIPEPMSRGLKVEEKFNFLLYGHSGPIHVLGYVDWSLATSKNSIIIGDHKFTGNLSYAKDTKEKLMNDPQACLYTAWKYEVGYDYFKLRWNYTPFVKQGAGGRIKTVKVLPVWVDVRHKDILPRMEKSYDSMVQMRELRERQIHPMDIEGNVESCGNYGGCPYLDYCTDMRPQSVNEVLSIISKRRKK